MKSVCAMTVIAGSVIGVGTPALASVSFSGFGAGSRANALSADGSTAVGRVGGRATRWVGTVPHDLNTFGDGSYSTASAVSADGSVIVGNAYNGDPFMPDTVAYRWTAGTGASSLGATGGSYEGWGAMGVSAGGSVVVGRTGFASAATAFGAPFGAPISYGRSAARGVSADGSVIVGFTRNDAGDRTEAFHWTGQHGTQLLGTLAGGANSGASAVSGDAATIVGWSESTLGRQAFRWSAIEGMIGLDDLAGGAFDSEALALSADGAVIVGTGTDALGATAVRWTTSGPVPIQSLLTGLGMDLTGWRLTAATGVSADGLTFVGNGLDPSGQYAGWIATVPAPGAPIAAGLLALLRHRSRREDR